MFHVVYIYRSNLTKRLIETLLTMEPPGQPAYEETWGTGE